MVSVSGSKCERKYPHCTHFTTAFNRMNEWMSGMLARIIFLLFRLHSLLPLYLVWVFFLLALDQCTKYAVFIHAFVVCAVCISLTNPTMVVWRWWWWRCQWWRWSLMAWLEVELQSCVFVSTVARQGMRENEKESARITMVGSWTWSHSKHTVYDARWDAVVW